MVDVGPVITPPGQYTHCVERGDYKDVPGVLDAGIPSILAFTLCEYLLGGKLVCLAGGGDECAIGIVVGLEAVDSKSGIDAIDNDFSFNVLLAPFQAQDFTVYGSAPSPNPHIADPHRVRDDIVKSGPLGWLMEDVTSPSTLPAPRDQTQDKPKGTATWPVDGYGVLWKLVASRLVDANREGDNLHKLWDTPSGDDWPSPPTTDQWIPLPVMHCECEGSRIFFVCQALKPFLDILQGKPPGGGPSPGEACHAVAEYLPWPLDKIVDAVCSAVEDLIALPIALALAPAMAAAFASAWEAAQAFDDLFVTGPVARQIHVGDIVIVKGRWDWDAGHSGHTELHPVKSIQKLMTTPGDPPGQLPADIRPAQDLSVAPPQPVAYDPRQAAGIPASVKGTITSTYQKWCRLVGEAPPPPDPRHLEGLSPPQVASLTPAQLAVWEAQNQPENSWAVHPLLDGCTPERPTDPIR